MHPSLQTGESPARYSEVAGDGFEEAPADRCNVLDGRFERLFVSPCRSLKAADFADELTGRRLNLGVRSDPFVLSKDLDAAAHASPPGLVPSDSGVCCNAVQILADSSSVV